MGIFDNIGEQVAQHGETIDQAIEKGAEFIDEKTGRRFRQGQGRRSGQQEGGRVEGPTNGVSRVCTDTLGRPARSSSHRLTGPPPRRSPTEAVLGISPRQPLAPGRGLFSLQGRRRPGMPRETPVVSGTSVLAASHASPPLVRRSPLSGASEFRWCGAAWVMVA